jgi:hypothetical protein
MIGVRVSASTQKCNGAIAEVAPLLLAFPDLSNVAAKPLHTFLKGQIFVLLLISLSFSQ